MVFVDKLLLTDRVALLELQNSKKSALLTFFVALMTLSVLVMTVVN